MDSSQVFTPYRSIGVVCDVRPLSVQHLGLETHVTSSLGSQLHTYSTAHLNLLFVSLCQNEHIQAFTAIRKVIIASVGKKLIVFKRGKIIASAVHGRRRPPSIIHHFGNVILTFSKGENHLVVWNWRTLTVLYELPLEGTDAGGVRVLCHPPTYVNKILVARDSGELQLYNIRTRKLIYTFRGWSSTIHSLVASPALDVVAVGLQNGDIIIYNIKLDKLVTSFHHAEGGATTALTFCSDESAEPCLASGHRSGQIALWSLTRRSLVTLLDAHSGPLSTVEFLPGQPVLLSSAQDNAIRMWLVDRKDSSIRPLRSRQGHTRPPSLLHFVENGRALLSAAADGSLWYFNLHKDERARELSQHHTQHRAKKYNVSEESIRLPPVTQVDTCELRLRDWDCVVTRHRNTSKAVLWSMDKMSMSAKAMETHDKAEVTAVCISACGNFVILGTGSGTVSRYNTQSALHRGDFVRKCSKSIDSNTVAAHEDMVLSISIDAINDQLITCGVDSYVRFWKFQSREVTHELAFEWPITTTLMHKECSLLAVCSDDLMVRIIDIDSHKVVRLFSGHTSQIDGLAFSGDARWLVTASSDKTIRVWDVMSGQCIDWFAVPFATTSLALSPRGDFLATTHLGVQSICLWSNNAHFSSIFLQPIPPKPPIVSLPGSALPKKFGTVEDDDLDTESDSDDMNLSESEDLGSNGSEKRRHPHEQIIRDGESSKRSREDETVSVTEPLAEGLVTFTGASRQRVKTLVNLELIKERNKPTERMKTTVLAPFMIPTIAGLEEKFDLTSSRMNAHPQHDVQRPSHVRSLKLVESASAWASVLCSLDWDEALAQLSVMNPSQIDFEVHCLSSEEQIASALMFVNHCLKEKVCFELLQGFLNVVLKAHEEAIGNSPNLLELARSLKETQEMEWLRLSNMFHSALCLSSYFTGSHGN